jgi:hypothetical protein
MKTMIQSQTSKTLQASMPFASPAIALLTMLLIAAGSGVATMMA